jgi:hypothetical protein
VNGGWIEKYSENRLNIITILLSYHITIFKSVILGEAVLKSRQQKSGKYLPKNM